MYLREILEYKAEEVKERKSIRPWASLAGEIEKKPASGRFRRAISTPGLSVVAEIKRASPSKGLLAPNLIAGKVAAGYEKSGAAALSVLTDKRFFRGSLADLQAAVATVSLPVLRKDFIIDPYQVLEARWAGADAVLLIMAALSESQAEELASCAKEFSLEILAEIHCAEELAQARAIKADIIGINNRDLNTFQVSLEVTYRLFPLIGGESPVISESGIKSRADLLALKELGVDGVLVGEALVAGDDPGQRLREFLEERP